MPANTSITAIPADDVMACAALVCSPDALEAMKMEQILSAAFDGVLAGLQIAVGQRIAEGLEVLRAIKVGS